jgi:hypothetical protein
VAVKDLQLLEEFGPSCITFSERSHQLMQTLNVCLSFDPAPVIQFAAAACRAASLMSYHFESTSSQEIVKLVEHVLADRIDVLRELSIAKDFGEMLDLFVSAGRPHES